MVSPEIGKYLLKQWKENYLSYSLALMGLCGLIMVLIHFYEKREPAEATTESPPDLRRQLLENLKAHYEGRLKAKMQGQMRFEIKLQLRYTLTGTSPAGVEDYFVIKEESDAGDFERLFETYVQKIRRLLILGEPGAGKSVLLLRFGLKLIEMAKEDPALPVPVILDLASWRGEDETFGDWLEANLPYIGGTFGISQDYAKVLRDQNLVLPLLDGFDEIREQERDGCFEKLRTYLEQVRNSRAQVYPEVVVCSRIWEYELAEDAPVAAAVMIQPLTTEDIQNTLRPLIADNDTPAKRLQKSLDENPTLLAATNSAFLLHTLLDLQTDAPVLNIKRTTPETIRDEIIEMYIQAELKKIKKYPREKARKWLGWLAWKMKYLENSVVFELNDFQSNWTRFKFSFPFLFAVCSAFISSIAWYYAKISILLGSFFSGTLAYYAVIIENKNIPLKVRKDNFRKFSFRYFSITPFVISIFYGLFFGYLIEWGFRFLVDIDFNGFLLGLITGIGLSYFSSFSIVVSIPKLNSPYQKLLSNRIGFSYLHSGILVPIALLLGFRKISTLMHFIYILPLSIGITITLSPIFQHFCLRLAFFLEKTTPFRLVSFLDAASFYQKGEKKNEVGLLLKDGGQWRFRHQLILDHLADWFEMHHPNLLRKEDLEKKKAEENLSRKEAGGGKSED